MNDLLLLRQIVFSMVGILLFSSFFIVIVKQFKGGGKVEIIERECMDMERYVDDALQLAEKEVAMERFFAEVSNALLSYEKASGRIGPEYVMEAIGEELRALEGRELVFPKARILEAKRYVRRLRMGATIDHAWPHVS